MIKIFYKSKNYSVDKAKLIYVLEALENKSIKELSDDDILKYFDKYNLYDEIFLKGVSVD